MSGDRSAVVERSSGVRVLRQPHVSYASQAPAPVTAGVEGHSHRRGLRVLATQVGRFLLHLLEMLLSMMVGMLIFNVLIDDVRWPLGYRLGSSSDPYLIGMAVFMVIPMAAWMRFRRMSWRPIAEMSAAMVALAILLVCAGWLGIVARSALNQLEHSLMVPVMLVAMLSRLGYYTSSHKTHRAHAA